MSPYHLKDVMKSNPSGFNGLADAPRYVTGPLDLLTYLLCFKQII